MRAFLTKGSTWVILFFAYAAVGCQGADGVGPDVSAVTKAQSVLRENGRPSEERFAKMAANVPGFAGYYYDDAGDLVIAATSPSAEASARQAAQSVLRDLPPQHGQGNIHFRVVQYTFAQLADWREKISRDLLGKGGLVSVDADEVRNRVTLGLDDVRLQPDLIAAIVQAGVPAAAVAFEQTYPTVVEDSIGSVADFESQPGTSLSSYFEPAPGGIRISYRYLGLPADKEVMCTMGFSGKSLNPAARSARGDSTFFLTASHCSIEQFGIQSDTTDFYQPDAAKAFSHNEYFLGQEKLDPNYFVCCVDHYKTRYSDALLADAQETRHLYIARVAKPRWYTAGRTNGQPGDTVVNQSDPYFYVTRQETSVPVGYVVDKVGFVSGWTRGTVNSTCVDRWGQPPGYKVLCNTLAYYWSRNGDSGSPVFIEIGGNQISAVGIHWAGFGADDGRQGSAVFSPLGTIQRGDELGTLVLR